MTPSLLRPRPETLVLGLTGQQGLQLQVFGTRSPVTPFMFRTIVLHTVQ